MSIFRAKRRRPAPREEADHGSVAEAQAPRTVGALLRETRLRHDADIHDIAARLRIRPAYLEAIEAGRYDRLPGAAYALGFVRAYAEHLGLDGHEISRRFKAETAGLEKRQDFAMPLPLPERSRPGGPILLTALILAACAYALWWYFDSGERNRPERVAALPEEIAPRLAPPPEPPAAQTEPVTTDPPAPPAETASELPPATAPVADMPSPAAAPPADGPQPDTPSAAAVPESTPPPAEAPAPPAPETPAPVPPAPSAPPVASVLPPPPPPPVPDVAPPAGPRVYGVTSGTSRILIRATADAWIRIQERDGTQVSRLLRPGESYRVPDRPGMTLRAGNAGGIEILVDGELTPSLGAPGQTRNVVLDPDRLRAGNAVIQ